MTPDTRDAFAELARLCADLGEGDWEAIGSEVWKLGGGFTVANCPEPRFAAFIAAARTGVPALLARIAELEAGLASESGAANKLLDRGFEYADKLDAAEAKILDLEGQLNTASARVHDLEDVLGSYVRVGERGLFRDHAQLSLGATPLADRARALLDPDQSR